MRRYVLAAAVLAILGWAMVRGLPLAYFAMRAADSSSEKSVIVEIHPGENTLRLSHTLEQEGIVSDGRMFHRLGRYTRKWDHLKIGEYELRPTQSPLEIFAVLASGVSVAHKITVREGENMYQIADDLAGQGLVDRRRFLSLAKDPGFIRELGGFSDPLPPSLEGYLFPETYFFNRSLGEREILTVMYRKFQDVWSAELEAQARSHGFTRHQAVTLASIVEKETGAPEERPLISSVFHNRLRKRMRLQSDPTTIYGIWEHFDGNLRKRDLLEKTPYNTYSIPALPIGPIANPGRAALRAAVEPAQSEFLFFVSRNDGTHSFSTSLEEHRSAVRKFQLDRSAREGKSWRDLQKRSH